MGSICLWRREPIVFWSHFSLVRRALGLRNLLQNIHDEESPPAQTL